MSAAVKSIIVAVLGLLLALVLGMMLGEGTWQLPLILVGAAIFAFLQLFFFRGLRIEALILGFLTSGYIVGNRGFAQLNLGGPLFLGEVGLAVCFVVLVGRFAINRKSLIPSAPLGWVLAGLLLLGGVRLYLDVFARLSGSSTMMAVRDSAVIYYAGFFFVAYQVGQDARARVFLERVIIIACVVLIPVAFLDLFFPGLSMRITFRGNPLIYQKGDLVTSFLAFSSFYFFLRPARGPLKAFFLVLSIAAFAGMLLFFQRAGLVGFMMAAMLLLVARRPQFLYYQAAVATVGLCLFLALQASDVKRGDSWLSQASDKVLSMTDMSGTQKYRGQAGEEKSGNNQFRLVWWKSVVDETTKKAPWFGLGFGYDLAAGFIRNYYAGMRMDFTARSPHSIWLTMLGRMGIIGFLAFTVITFLICRQAVQAALAVARRQAKVESLSHWCAVLALLGAATFGVILEGPMGAVLFWTFLGLASSQRIGETAEDKPVVEQPVRLEHRQFRPVRRPQLVGARL